MMMKYFVSLPGIVEGLEVFSYRPLDAALAAVEQYPEQCAHLAFKDCLFVDVEGGGKPRNGGRSRTYRIRCVPKFVAEQKR